MSVTTSDVCVIYGPHDLELPIAGNTVADVIASLGGSGGLLNMPLDAAAYVNSEKVDVTYILQPGDRLELMKEIGAKGAWEEPDRILLERLVAAVEKLVGRCAQPEVQPPRLNATEELIVRNLGTNKMTGEEIAKHGNTQCSSNFKQTLSSLRKRGILENTGNGYFIAPKWLPLLSNSLD